MQSADRQRFEQTVLPHLDSLYGMAVRLTCDRADAEDLVQDVLVRAYRFWASYRPGTSIRAWLFTILRNTHINCYHARRRRRAATHEFADQLTAIREGPIPRPPPAPDRAVALKATRAAIDEALARLPEDYRLAVTLADLEGLSYREIAGIMDCPIGTVMSRIYRGRKRLHGLLRSREREDLSPPIALADYRERGAR